MLRYVVTLHVSCRAMKMPFMQRFPVLNTRSTGWTRSAYETAASDSHCILSNLICKKYYLDSVAPKAVQCSYLSIALCHHSFILTHKMPLESLRLFLQASPSIHGGKEQARQGGVQSAIVNMLEPFTMAQKKIPQDVITIVQITELWSNVHCAVSSNLHALCAFALWWVHVHTFWLSRFSTTVQGFWGSTSSLTMQLSSNRKPVQISVFQCSGLIK